MKLTDTIEKLHAPKGLTSMLAGVHQGDMSVLPHKDGIGLSAEEAQAELSRATDLVDAADNDAIYWSRAGDKAYWSAIVNLHKAAAITGEDNLPDVEVPDLRNAPVMSCIGQLEEFGRKVLQLAREKA